jgi:hypothetical protein
VIAPTFILGVAAAMIRNNTTGTFQWKRTALEVVVEHEIRGDVRGRDQVAMDAHLLNGGRQRSTGHGRRCMDAVHGQFCVAKRFDATEPRARFAQSDMAI